MAEQQAQPGTEGQVQQADDFPHERTPLVAPVAPSGWTGRLLTTEGPQIAAPAPTPHPGDPDLTKWSKEDEQGGEGGESMASDEEAFGEEGNPGDYTVGELVDYLETVDNTARLDELKSMEEARPGGARANALRAIEDRREELNAASGPQTTPTTEPPPATTP